MIVEIKISKDKVKVMPVGSLDALQREMTKRVGIVYPDVEVIVKPSSNDSLSVLRAPDKDKAKKFVENTLQNTWESADDWFY
ncbi:damage-inducible protein DinI [bacteria symbiont BFo2 of Frankliniella occidentalis]|nr:damage-inducible protein DinI [bacteria symbiont BFo2 of Frankliniella occidentalis]KYP94608.1 damage-inducible protein DinI [bacteria symbiont BFo2 of Frankliniella occidentalis]